MEQWMNKLVVDCEVYNAKLTAKGCTQNQLVAQAASAIIKRYGIKSLTGWELDRLIACSGCKKTDRKKWKIQGLMEMLKEEVDELMDRVERGAEDVDYQSWDRIRDMTRERVRRFRANGN